MSALWWYCSRHNMNVRGAPATRHMTVSFHFISFHNSLSIVISSHYYIHKQRSLSIYTLAPPVLSLQNSFEYEKLS
ncbi:hypothetical protein RSOLAG1IB_09059 [Rhizoctonia solani AG-1 IB]|uniref:Uncharacterized protein n=1 Tax=Thanatephorus cucumeris (strain AG1-IB / isolate 7/3/14) TaxID=1108050 RepID=A0A0B7FSC6_THACB|nr:hypothetical protein RSOLAG1IB_09059 [Rhizoctonia solani AG-1 IB]